MLYVGLLVVLVVLLALIIHVATGEDRYAKMTEEEFEAEARRVSLMGVAATELQRHIDPQHKVEYIAQRDKHVEADSAESDDRPPGPPSDKKR